MSGQRSHPDALLARAKALDWRWYGLAVGVVGVCTGAAWLMFPYFSPSNLIMIYLLGVVAVAARATRGPTVLASVLSVAAFNFFFVPPRLSFGVSDTEHLFGMGSRSSGGSANGRRCPFWCSPRAGRRRTRSPRSTRARTTM